jgi:hypothetical protein
LYVDPAEPDRLKAYLIDANTELEPVRSALSQLVGNYPQFDVSKIDPVLGSYGFLELQNWLDQLSPEIVVLPGWVSSDNNEGINRLQIGVRDQSTSDAISSMLPGLSIPADAVTFTYEEPAQPKDLLSPR